MPKKFDVVIIGSGAAGSLAAYRLVKAGVNVLMIDGGVPPVDILEKLPANLSFEKLRKLDPNQRRIFLGTDYSALEKLSSEHSTQMTTGNRGYITAFTQKLLPLKAKSFSLLQSLAKGGLSEAWGGACDFFTPVELDAVGLPVKPILTAYQAVINVIGVSGKHPSYTLQPAAKLDTHAQGILQLFQKKASSFHKKGVTVYQPPLALLTKPLKNRAATNYTDLDFWSNTGRSVFRPHYLIDELLQNPNFTYKSGYIVESFTQKKNSVSLTAKQFSNGATQTFSATTLVLAAGSINSTKIVLRSLKLPVTSAPIIIKPHVVIPCFDLQSLLRPKNPSQHSLCQLVIKSQPSLSQPVVSYAQLYNYKSLLLYKLLPSIPLPAPIAIKFLQLLSPHFVLADLRFSSTGEAVGKSTLRSSGSNYKLEIEYTPLEKIQRIHRQSLALMKRSLWQLGLIPLSTVWMPTGSTAHYAGGIPNLPRSISESENNNNFSQTNEAITTQPSGQLTNYSQIFVADASSWRALPAKPPTLTIMANAYRVAGEVLKVLKKSA